ncbi:MAG: hypothetical protein ACKV2O_22860 [Acidimicrobiales bacterium]
MRIRSLMLMVAATLLLSGCFRHQSSVMVNEDGSGSITETLVVNRDALGPGDVPPAPRLPRAGDLSLPGWITAADYVSGTDEGLILNVDFQDPAQFNERLNALHRLLASETGSAATSTVALTRLESGWEFIMRTNNVSAPPEPAGTNPTVADALYHSGQLTLVVDLPGQVTEHNADQETDGKLVWFLSAQAIQSQFYARTQTGDVQTRSPRDDRTLQLATAAATIGGLAVFAAVALNRKRTSLATAAAPNGGRVKDDPAGSAGGPILGAPAGPPPPLSSWPTTPPPNPPSVATPPHAGPPPPR